MSSVGEKEKADYKKRKLVVEVTDKLFTLTKGPDFALTIAHTEAELTPEMLQSGSWKETDFKPYNFAALGVTPPGGHLHPLLKVRILLLIYNLLENGIFYPQTNAAAQVRAEYRQIFLEMGFTEMPTNNFVESSFWNFDALFQPQQHPAR